MDELIRALLDPSGLTPHGFCLLWEPGLIWLHAISDTVIGVAYYSIPIALIYFVRRRRDVAFGWVFWLFAAFILACGTTHFLSVLTLWEPAYWIDGLIKTITALLSMATAITLWPLIPRALALPSPEILRRVNAELARQIADRDQAEAALRVSEARLRQAQKMETIGQLTGGMAHDFNNLLTVMLGGMEMVGLCLARIPAEIDVSRIRNSAELAIQAVRRAATLTERLLAFSRRQPLEPKPIDVNRLIEDMSDMLSRALGASVAFKTTLAPGVWLAIADPNQLENALLNLSLNARDAMPKGGDLTIATDNAELSQSEIEQFPEPVAPGAYVVIAVSDTGVGMDRATLDQAFEPFFTTKEIGKGTGLGLSQVYGFVRQSGGQIRLESEPGQGTTARIFLPSLRGVAEAPVPRAESSSAVRRGGETILVVEDHDSLRAYSTEALRELGYRVLQAATAAAALAVLEAESGIELVFTDVVLAGGMNGCELADEVTRRWPDIRILFTTGYDRGALRDSGRLDESVPLITKPFTYKDLAAKVRSVLDQNST
jgi:signal transduction histidine kinase/CheY-like chemotaxis protein